MKHKFTLFKSVLSLFILMTSILVAQPANISPADGATVTQATTSISWDDFEAGGVDNHYNFRFYGTDGTYTTIVESGNVLVNSWTLAPANLPLAYSTTYYWQVQDDEIPGTWHGYSFTTEADPGPAITLTSPTGGESWGVGSTQNITWTETSLTGTIDIDYFNGTSWSSITTGIALGTNTYSWTVPSNATTSARVRVTDNGSSVTDESGDFTIYQRKLGIPTLVAPADLDDLVPLNPTFSWTQHLDATGIFDNDEVYDLEIAIDQWFANIVRSETNIATGGAGTSFDYSLVPFEFDLNTKYYWRVRAKTVLNPPTVYSPWSATFVFTTTAAVVKPTQTFPINGNIVYSNTPTFYWYTGMVSNDQYFEVWYGDVATVTDPDNAWAYNTPVGGTGNFVDASTVGRDLFYTVVTPLVSNTDYKWWVRSTDGVNVSDWSAMGTFSTSSTNGGPVEPVGTYPTLGEYQYTNNPYIYWYIITQVTGLEFEISVTTEDVALPSAAGTLLYDAVNSGTNYFYQLSGLTSSTVYYWWVRSTDGINVSDWSERYSFATTSSTGSPVKPVLTYPANGETVYFADVDLSWYTVTIATDLKYNLQWGTSTDRASNANTEIGITNLYTSVSGLTANTTYYWWIQSTDNAGNNGSDWSDMGTFVASESAAQVKVPTPMYPTAGITVTGTDIDLSWAYFGEMAGITFEARYSLYPDMTLPTGITLTDPTATSETVTFSTGTTYYWQVRAINASYTPDMVSAWSVPAQFSTWASAEAPLVVPMTGSPIANVTIDTDSPTLSWFLPTQSEGLSYDLEYSVTGRFDDAVEIKNISTNSVQLNNLTDGKTYFWRVRSIDNSGNTSLYSAIGSFVGQGVTGVEEDNIMPEKFEVSQNYPNPFNPSTMIEYALPEAEYVTIRIYNMLGQEVATLVNNQVEAGVHSVTWNGVDNSGVKVATGSYIYRVVAGNNIMTKKMILLK